MTHPSTGWHIGKRIAPPRFLLFCLALVVALIVAIPPLGWGMGTLAAFDGASVLFLASLLPLLGRGEAAQMRNHAQRNDANRIGLLAITAVVMAIILVAVAGELSGDPDALQIALAIGTLALAWLFSNVVYALHYAHLFYLGDGKGGDCGGLDVPECDEPDYWDFLYFSVTFGVALATSDIRLTSRRMRRVAIGQCIAGWVFNIGVIAFAISVIGGG